MLSRAAILLLALPTAALAAPVALSHSGYVLDAADAPLDTGAGTRTFQFDLFASSDPQAGAPVWASGPCALPVRAGYYSAVLGAQCGSGLDNAQLAATRWLRVTVSDVALLPLVRIDPAPAAASALEAALAKDLSCTGCVAALETTGLVALSPGTAQAGDIAVTGSIAAASFAGDGAGLTNLDATKISGTLSDTQLASGSDLLKRSGAQTVSGVKTFDPSTGTAPFAVGAGKTGVVANLNADLFDGVHLFSLPFSCPAGQAVTGFTNTAGTVTPVCATLTGASSTLGTSSNPAIDCRAIKAADANAVSALYYVDPDGNGTIPAQQVWCEMTGDGKGWTLCAAFGHQKHGDGFTFLNTSWQTGNRAFWTGAAVGGYGQFCNELTINELYAKSLSSTTALTFTTLQVSTGGVNPFSTNAKNSFSNGSSRIAVWVKGSLQLNYFGQNATCADFNNSQTQGSNLCISDGTNWQTMQGNINGGTGNKDWMCAPNTSCGVSSTNVVLFYAR